MDTSDITLQLGDAGLLFPAISLLMLAYTNRYLGLAGVARQLGQRYRENGDESLELQVRSLLQRLQIIRHTQALGVLSLLICTLCLGALFLGSAFWANSSFAAALVFMMASLGTSLWEIHLSIHAIGLDLQGFLNKESK